jgi:hypothetical protein
VTITGVGTDVDFGWSIAPVGDVNGDGFTDLVVGDPSNGAVAQFAGRAYLFQGPLTKDIDTSKAVATISAEAFGDNLGFSVASAGDVNGDGIDDILIGARSNDANGIQSGRVYLFYGPVSGSLAATTADAIIVGANFDEVGRAVAGVGDLNGDGFGDIVLGTEIAGGSSRGQIFIFNGPLSGIRTAASANAIISGSFPNESFGASVASAGDVNGGRGERHYHRSPKISPGWRWDGSRLYLLWTHRSLAHRHSGQCYPFWRGGKRRLRPVCGRGPRREMATGWLMSLSGLISFSASARAKPMFSMDHSVVTSRQRMPARS